MITAGTSTKRQNKKAGMIILVPLSMALLFLIFIISVSVGSVGISISDTLRIITGLFPGAGKRDDILEGTATILLNVRLPRVILSAMVGSALSLAGAAMQGLLKNPLADGSTLGITAGGALGAVLSIVLGISLPVAQGFGLALMSITFSFISLILIMSLSYRIDKSLSTQTIILTGVVFSMLAGSITSLLVALSGSSLKQVVFWSMGSFSGRGWYQVLLMLPFFLAGTIPLLCLCRELNAFSLGEEQARYLGVNIKRIKLLILVLVSILVGISVAVSGTIGFAGLIIPHITRLITGPDHKKLMPLSILIGAGFLMLVDLLSRSVLSPSELPIGVFTSLAGAMVFIVIFYSRSNKKG